MCVRDFISQGYEIPTEGVVVRKSQEHGVPGVEVLFIARNGDRVWIHERHFESVNRDPALGHALQHGYIPFFVLKALRLANGGQKLVLLVQCTYKNLVRLRVRCVARGRGNRSSKANHVFFYVCVCVCVFVRAS